jgi:hypothetical protein
MINENMKQSALKHKKDEEESQGKKSQELTSNSEASEKFTMKAQNE